MSDPIASDADPAVVAQKERFRPPPPLHAAAAPASAARIAAPGLPKSLLAATASPRASSLPPATRSTARGPAAARTAVQASAKQATVHPGAHARTERRPEGEEQPGEGKRRPREDAGGGDGRQGHGPPDQRPSRDDGRKAPATALAIEIVHFHAALGTNAGAPAVPVSSLPELVQKVEVLMRQCQLPSLALTLSGSLSGRIELLRSGPGCVRIHVGGRWSGRNRQALEAELSGRGIRVTAWTTGGTA